MKSALLRLLDLPPLRALRRAKHERRVWTTDRWLFHGVFDSYQSAFDRAKDHPVQSVGYDTPGVAEKGRAHYEQLFEFDHPAIRMLEKALAHVDHDRPHIVDLGGSLGEKFRVFRRESEAIAGAHWTVLETASTVADAAKLTEADLPEGLSFTADTKVMDGAHILFASGSLQYLDYDFHDALEAMDDPPAALVLNKLPLSDGPECWTLQNAATIIPYHIFNRDQFLGRLVGMGYRIVDEWLVPRFTITVPFHPEVGTRGNSGLYLVRD